ncbi:MAG TPA: methionine synthase, partial [Pseudothermotoga sp.]|nr:methionine synthase [Pseudothermotoga sp.]
MMKILGASIGSCVHNVGLLNFLEIAKQNNYETIYIGSAIPVDELVREIKKHDPDMIAMSYRLAAEALHNLLR